MSKSDEKRRTILASDRSMDAHKEDRSELFFFPKANPPASIRAASLEEAEAILEARNPKEA